MLTGGQLLWQNGHRGYANVSWRISDAAPTVWFSCRGLLQQADGCAKVLLNSLLFLPTPRNASFTSVDEVLIFQANKSSAVYICPPICSGIASAAVTGRKDFTAAVAVFFLFLVAHCLDKASFLSPSLPLPLPLPLSPWPVFFSESPELINFLAYLYYFSVIFSLSISHPPLRTRKLPQQQ